MNQEIEDRINAIAARDGGHLTPDAVIEDARDPASPLHSQFNWDKDLAAYEHWRETARRIIRSVRVVVHTERKLMHTVAYVRDPASASTAQGYIAIAKLRTDRERAAQAIAYEMSRAHAAMRRAREVSDALELLPDVDEIIDRIQAVRDRVRVDV